MAGERHLVPADSAAVKQRYVRDWERAQREFARRQQEWNRFRNEERPAYEQWVRQTFGARISELRALQEKTGELRQLVGAVEHYGDLCGKRPRALFQELLAEQREGESLLETLNAKIQRWNTPDSDDDGRDDETGTRSVDFDLGEDDSLDDDEGDDDFTAEFDDIMDALGSMFGFKRPPRATPKEAKQRQLKIRDLYRKLCRRLHPDTGQAFSAETEQLWHQVQEAYEKGDLDRLEAIQAGIEVRLDPMGKHVSCSQLAAAAAGLRQGVHSIRALIRQAKRDDAAWGFAAWTARDRARAEQRLLAEFEHDHTQLASQLRYLERLVEKWRKPMHNKRQKSAMAAAKHPRQLAFDF